MGVLLYEPAVLELYASDYTHRDGCIQVGIRSIPSNWVNLELLGGPVEWVEQSSSQKARTALEQLVTSWHYPPLPISFSTHRQAMITGTCRIWFSLPLQSCGVHSASWTVSSATSSTGIKDTASALHVWYSVFWDPWSFIIHFMIVLVFHGL